MTISALFMTFTLWCSGTLGSQPAVPPPPSLTDSATVRRIAEDSTRAFLLTWRKTWESDFDAHKSDYAIDELRAAHGHCHARTGQADEFSMRLQKNYEVIKGRISDAAVCPSWELGRDVSPTDEADSIDAAITPGKVAGIRAARERLLDALNAAQDSLPGDKWIVGQRVRFLLDQGRAKDALLATRACHMDVWWCSALGAYVLTRQGAFASADSAFRFAGAALPPDLRCEWNDIRVLLPDSVRKSYAGSPCESRNEVAERYWWLADPLFSVRGNRRRTEHYARRVMILLHSALDEDERYHYAPAFGGDAVEEMLLSFGWPTAGYWVGREEDRGHDNYLHDAHSLSAAPYSSAEYSTPRVHFGATWAAVNDPLHADAAAWQLNAPDDLRTTRKGRGDFWWPIEHMRYSGNTVVQFLEGQTAFFRRQSDIQVAAAVGLPPDSKDAPARKELATHEVTTALVVSPAPESYHVVSSGIASSASRVALLGFIPSQPALLAIEVQSTAANGPAARTRFGILPPLPLDSLTKGTLAMSDPVFFAPPADGSAPSSVESMLPHMLGTSAISRGDKIGIFWENYGVAESDSIRFAITATAMSGRSFMQKLASALKISSDGVSNVAVSWVDSRIDIRKRTIHTPVTIAPRSVILDMRDLPRGTYSIEVAVSVAGHDPVRATRMLTIR